LWSVECGPCKSLESQRQLNKTREKRGENQEIEWRKKNC
jgi:hypothetical protein